MRTWTVTTNKMTAEYDWATWVLAPVQKVDSDGVESRFSIGITQTAPFRPLIPRRISQLAQCTTQVGQILRGHDRQTRHKSSFLTPRSQESLLFRRKLLRRKAVAEMRLSNRKEEAVDDGRDVVLSRLAQSNAPPKIE